LSQLCPGDPVIGFEYGNAAADGILNWGEESMASVREEVSVTHSFVLNCTYPICKAMAQELRTKTLFLRHTRACRDNREM